jgi:hypothetical protein
MDRFTQVLAGLLGQSARLLPASLREWTEAVLPETREVSGRGRPAARSVGSLVVIWCVDAQAPA